MSSSDVDILKRMLKNYRACREETQTQLKDGKKYLHRDNLILSQRRLETVMSRVLVAFLGGKIRYTKWPFNLAEKT